MQCILPTKDTSFNCTTWRPGIFLFRHTEVFCMETSQSQNTKWGNNHNNKVSDLIPFSLPAKVIWLKDGHQWLMRSLPSCSDAKSEAFKKKTKQNPPAGFAAKRSTAESTASTAKGVVFALQMSASNYFINDLDAGINFHWLVNPLGWTLTITTKDSGICESPGWAICTQGADEQSSLFLAEIGPPWQYPFQIVEIISQIS